MPELVSRQRVHTELDEARIAFHRLVAGATDTELRSASDGTRWTNEELLVHMLFGYLIARPLVVLAGVFSRLPKGASRGFASARANGITVPDRGRLRPEIRDAWRAAHHR